MRTRIVAAFVAGGLLVGAGFLTSVISSPGTAQAQEETDDTERAGPIPRIIGVLSDVLDELVEEGTLNEEQADAVVAAVEDKVEAAKERREEARGLFNDLFDDGVLTAEEAEQLPDDHPLFGDAFDEAWEDGELTVEELFRLGHRRFFRSGRGSGFGALPFGDFDSDAFPSVPRCDRGQFSQESTNTGLDV